MPRKAKPTVTPIEPVKTSVRIEVRVVVENHELEGVSQLLLSELEYEPGADKEDIENAVFSVAVAAVNAAAWDIGLGEIFEVLDD